MTVVQLEQVKHRFGDVEALKGINLSLDKGETLGLFGHNGAGKTTIIKLILGLLRPVNGSVSVFGHDPVHSDFRQQRYKLGFLPENVSFYQQLTGLDVLEFLARLKNIPVKDCDQHLQQVGLDHAKNRKVKTYSKGMRQRLGLAQALLSEPSLLLLDEPTVGLDPIATQDFYSIIDNLRKKGCAIVLCSHVLPGVEKYINKAAILSAGELQAWGSLEELSSKLQLPVTVRIQTSENAETIVGQLSKQLADCVQSSQRIGENTLEFQIMAPYKMPLLRELVQNEAVFDIDIQNPSLDQLYKHYMVGDVN